jgi:uncharacterized membrane protein required for colicin V production
MQLDKLPFNWFDFLILVVVLLGIVRGRKNGLSQELLPMLQWLVILFAAAFGYKPAGDFMAQNSVFSPLFCYVICFITIGIGVKILFSLVKRALGGKLVGSDVFGSTEYYLGMLAGMVRFTCVLLFLVALLNARLYSAAELKAMKKYQDEVYGSNFFPGLHTVQSDVLRNSFLGPNIRRHLGFLLIQPTPPGKVDIKRRQIEDI